jgi:hypothetical protein
MDGLSFVSANQSKKEPLVQRIMFELLAMQKKKMI